MTIPSRIALLGAGLALPMSALAGNGVSVGGIPLEFF